MPAQGDGRHRCWEQCAIGSTCGRLGLANLLSCCGDVIFCIPSKVLENVTKQVMEVQRWSEVRGRCQPTHSNPQNPQAFNR